MAQIEGMGRRSLAVQGRLGDVEQCRRVVREAIGAFGGLDVLVNNAGVTRALDFLRQRAPVGIDVNRPDSRKFRDSFFVGVDGRFIRAADFKPAMIPPTVFEVDSTF